MTWTAAFGAGLAALVIHRHIPSLADPVSCPGALEIGGALAARLAPAAPLATILRIANVVFTVAGVAVTVRLMATAAESVVMGAAVGLAVASMSVLAPEMTVSPWPAIAAAAWAYGAIARPARDVAATGSLAGRARVEAVAALMLSAAIAPPLALPFAVIACGYCWSTLRTGPAARRAIWIAGTAAGFALLVALTVYLLPPLPAFAASTAPRASCLIPVPSAISAAALTRSLTAVFAGVGPLAISLAAFGAFALRGRLGARSLWPAVAIGVAPLLVVPASPSAGALRTFAPLAVGFWWLVAAGLREVATMMGPGGARRLGAFVIVAGVPLFQFASLRDPAVPRPAPFGHETLSVRSFARLAGTLPADSLLVAEDAIVDMLERAAQSAPSVASRRLGVVLARTPDLTAAFGAHRVFALPRAQLDLQREGFRLQDPPEAFVRGLAEVRPGGACGAMGATWTDLAGLPASNHLALVADGPDARGPIIIYLGSDAPLKPAPLEWPDLSRRGFFESHYDTSRDADRRQLDADLAIDRGPAAHPALGTPVVTRLELWRVPGAPLSLVVSLDHAPREAVARTRDAVSDSGIRVCPSFEYSVSRLQIPLR